MPQQPRTSVADPTRLPPLGAWVRVRTNAGADDGSFLGCVIRHYARPEQPELFYAVNRFGGIEAAPAELAAILTEAEVAALLGVAPAYVAARTQTYLEGA